MATETVAVTGGSGRIGSAIIEALSRGGYRTVNLDRDSATGAADEFRRTDLLDAGETYGALAVADANAVIHMGTLPGPRQHPGSVTYESNVMTSYHVLEAAGALGIDSVCLASSINAVGWTFQEAAPDIRYLPLDEDHPATPRDPYGLAKRVIEVTADGFGRLEGPPRTVSSLRLPGVHSPARVREYAEADRSLERLRETFPEGGNYVFDYVHVEDAARLARAAIEAEFTGHETFLASAPDTNADVPTETLLAEFHPEVPVRGDLDGYESLINTAKARDLLDWTPTRSWRDR